MRVYARAKNQAVLGDWCRMHGIDPAALVYIPLGLPLPPLQEGDRVIVADLSQDFRPQAAA